ncbi:DUF4251 domain-containing protein [Chryseobacterium luquanense]|uniref:DUF4251 domain-containing protein n=1 Tax=Chryseobacterium luquanense TaxID=2983766 RepID=A0ABT3Y900_9FLAO|nr:DUF4251 domain-containing protein [Chryseobacterium luquanense]MCX8534529.1 DUF4251 domain-containing protein [Chryseobacterium luquanense]
MKNYIKIISAFALILFFQNCTAQKTDPQIVNNLVSTDEFTFHAEKANPTNFDVINVVNSMPNAQQLRTFQISGENYGIEIKKGVMEVTLPYFGRSFNAGYGSSDTSYRFTSKDYAVTKSQSKKGNWVYKIKPNDVKNVSDINIEIYKNGKASTSIRSNDRQPISYDGYISKNEETKEQEKL